MVSLISNKLRVLTRPLHGARTVTTWWGIECGSADDPEGKSGLAHLAEHLLGLEMNRLGPFSISSCGGTVTAHTGLDVTSFTWTLPACYWDAAILRKVFGVTSTDSPEAIAVEKSVVLAERERQRLDRSWNLSTSVFRAAFGGSGYGRPVIGLPEQIISLSVEDVAAQRRRYQTAAQTIVLAGAIDPAHVSDVLEAAMERPPGADDAMGVTQENRDAVLPATPRLGIDGHRFHALTPVPPATHPDALPMLLAAMMMGAGPWWRTAMDRFCNPAPGYASSISSLKIDYGLHRKTGIWHVSGLAHNPVEQIESFIQNQLRFCFFRRSSEESLFTAKIRALRSFAYTMEQTGSRAAWLGRMAIFLDICDEQRFRDQLQTITLSDVQRVVTEYLLRTASESTATATPAQEAVHGL